MDAPPEKVPRGCLWVATGAITLAVAALFVTFGLPMLAHDRQMDEWRQLLDDAPLPAGAEVIDRGSEFGLLGGNGNHCDLLAWVELRTDASPAEVAAHFEDVIIRDAGSVSATPAGPGTVRVELFNSIEPGRDIRCH